MFDESLFALKYNKIPEIIIPNSAKYNNIKQIKSGTSFSLCSIQCKIKEIDKNESLLRVVKPWTKLIIYISAEIPSHFMQGII